MKKIVNWMLAAILVCGTSVFTSCANDDNPAQEQADAKKNREVFIDHTRATLKDLAENLNFSSWDAANTYNMFFNQYVLNNKEFESSLGWTILQMFINNVKNVEEGSELAAMGYKKYLDFDFSKFKYRFTMREGHTDFNFEAADNLEFILNGFNPKTQQVENGIYKVTLNMDGTGVKKVSPVKDVEDGAFVLTLPTALEFTLSSKVSGAWHDDFSGVIRYQLPEGVTDVSQGYNAEVTLNSDILEDAGKQADKTQLVLSISSDRVNGHASGQCCWTQNGRKMFELSVKESGENMGGISNLDMSQYTSSSSIFEVIGSILGTRSIDEARLTLLDDLTTTFSVGNLQTLLELENEYRTVGRNYADKETIDEYTKKLNDLVKAEIYCKATDQTLPMRLATTPVGIDYWAVYQVKFSDEDWVSLYDMLDRKTFEYVLNIMDHSTDRMQQSVIVMRQLLEFIQVINRKLGDYGFPEDEN